MNRTSARRQFLTPLPAGDEELTDRLASGLAAMAVVCFVATLPAPFFRLSPRLGSPFLESVVTLTTGDSFEPQTFTLLGGIFRLWRDGQPGLALILFVFSVIFPAVKLGSLVLRSARLLPADSVAVTWLTRLGKWSMLDVLVLAPVVVSFKAFPGGTRVEMCWGVWTFAVSILASMAVGQLADRESSALHLQPLPRK